MGFHEEVHEGERITKNQHGENKKLVMGVAQASFVEFCQFQKVKAAQPR